MGRPDSRAWRRWLAALLVFVLFAAACGGDDDSGGDGGDGDDTDTSADEGTPKPGGELVYGLEAETNGGYCLPEAQLAISGIQVARTFYDTLAAPNADGEIKPFLAESIEPNDDFSEWTIALREGIKFHDGSDLDAQIVADNLDAYRGAYKDDAGKAIRSPQLFIFTFLNIKAVEVVDPLTVKVTTTVPWIAFPWYLWGSSRVGIMGRSQLDAPQADCAEKINGTGPFELDHWDVNEELVGTKNASYWQEGLPYLDKITYKPISESGQRVNALTGKQIDITHTSDTEQLAQQLRPKKDSGALEILESDSFGEVNYIMLNASIEPFDNKNARLAAAYALDRQLLIDTRGGGIGEVANGPFQKDVVGYTEDTGLPEFNLDEAKKYAAAYKEDTGKDLKFTYSYVTSESGTLTAQEIQTEMKDAGIDMDLNSTGDQATAINEALAGEFQAIGWRNHPGADPDTQYVWWREGSPVNFGRIKDAKINELLDKGRSDPEDREATYQELNQRFGSEAYNLWTSWTVWAIANLPKVNGVLGPDLPDGGGKPFVGLGTGHPVTGLWVSS